MKNFLAVICFMYVTMGMGQSKRSGVIEVEIVGVESNEGQMVIGLYSSDDQWLKKIYKGTYSAINDGKANATFKDIPEGEYAISVFHDEDNNGKLKTFMGIPRETVGCSNNAPARFGPPKWQDAKFYITDKVVKQHIQL